MTKDISDKTILNAQMLNQGFSIRTCIFDTNLSKGLTNISVEQINGKFDDVRVIPGDLALKGSKVQLAHPCHIVYVKYNKDHREYFPGIEQSYTPSMFCGVENPNRPPTEMVLEYIKD